MPDPQPFTFSVYAFDPTIVLIPQLTELRNPVSL